MQRSENASLRSPDVFGRLLGTLLSVLIAGCSLAGAEGGDDVVGGIDLDVLFAPAQAAEIEGAAEGWVDRDVSARGIELVREDELTHAFAPGWRANVRVVAHEVGGATHYGAVIVPSVEPERERPVLLYLHGGDAGVRMSDVATALAFTPGLRDAYIVVVPSFRSEVLSIGGDEYRSEGPASPWDRDVDDAIALLNVALETTPAADGERVVVLGFSRGAAVALLAAARDARIDGVVSFFGPTDFLGAFARDVTRQMLRGDLPDLPGIRHLNDTLLEPLRDGEIGIDAVRLDLIRRSPVYFVDRLPAVQIHHGLNDPIVPPAEGMALAEALEQVGHPDYEAYFYEGGSHDALTLSGALDRLTTFLSRWTTNDPPA